VGVLAGSTITASADVFNLFNWQAVTGIDEVYTNDNVDPVPGRTVAQIKDYRTADGAMVDSRDGWVGLPEGEQLAGAAGVPLRPAG
jgi:hypothetical protein